MKKLFFVTALLLGIYFKTQAQTPCPSIIAGIDITTCYQPGSGIALQAQATGQPAVVWRSTGSGYFSDSSLATTYFPSPQDYNNGSIRIIAENMGNNACVVTVDTLVITFKQKPTLEDGAGVTVCKLDSIPLHAATQSGNTITWMGGDGKFLPDNHSADVVYFPGTNDKKDSLLLIHNSVQSPEGCLNYDTVSIFHANSFYVNAGPDQYGCDTSFRLAGISNAPSHIWTSSGSGTFSPSNTFLNAIYFPSQADIQAKSVTLTLNAYASFGCGAVSDTAVINLNSGSFNIITYYNACLDTLQFWAEGAGTAGAIWTTTGSGVFTYTGATSNNFYTITSADRQAGNITITAVTPENAMCSATGTYILKTFPRPIVNAGPDQQRYGYTDAQLAGTVINSSGSLWTSYGSGTFSDNTDPHATYTASSADIEKGYVTLSLSTNPTENCFSINDEVVIRFTDSYLIEGYVYLTNDSNTTVRITLFKNNYYDFTPDTSFIVTGNYSFRRPSGQYIVLAQAVAAEAKYLPTYYGNTSVWSQATVIDNTGKDITNAYISLIPMPKTDSSWVGKDSISGTVYADGILLSQRARTSAFDFADVNVILKDSKGSPIATTTSDANGYYYFANIGKGNYTVTIDYPQMAATSIQVSVDGDPSTHTSGDIKATVLGTFGASKSIMTLNSYPNPAKDLLTIDLPQGLSGDVTVNVIENTGRNVLNNQIDGSGSSVLLNIQTLPQGFYILQLSDGNNTYRNKFYKTN